MLSGRRICGKRQKVTKHLHHRYTGGDVDGVTLEVMHRRHVVFRLIEVAVMAVGALGGELCAGERHVTLYAFPVHGVHIWGQAC